MRADLSLYRQELKVQQHVAEVFLLEHAQRAVVHVPAQHQLDVLPRGRLSTREQVRAKLLA